MKANNSNDIITSIYKGIHNNILSNQNMVQVIEHLADVLNLQTITNYAKSEKISYNGAKKRKIESININGIKFLINND